MKRAIKRAVSRRAKFLWSTPALREGCAAVAGVKTKVKAQAEAKAVLAAEAKAKARATARAEAEAKAAQAEAEEQACNQQSRRLQRRPQQRSSHMTTSSALSCRTSRSTQSRLRTAIPTSGVRFRSGWSATRPAR